MIQEKTRINSYLALCFCSAITLHSFTSYAQSLVGNSVIKSFQEISFSDTALQVGSGNCVTSITKVQVAKNGLLVSMNKPKSCKFKNIELTMGTEVFPLSGLGEEFEQDGEHYKWRSNFPQGSLLFAKTESQIFTPLNALRIREPQCLQGSCLTSAVVLVVTTPAKIVVPTQASSNVAATLPEPAKQAIAVVQSSARLVCTDNSDGTFTAKDGVIWQKCAAGQTWQNGSCVGERKTGNWYEAVNLAKNDRFLGRKDWVIPTEQLVRNTFIVESCDSHADIKKRDSESVNGYWWTSTPGKNKGQSEIMSENTGGGSADVDFTARTKNDWNGKPTTIGVTLVRIPVASEVITIFNAFVQAETDPTKRLTPSR